MGGATADEEALSCLHPTILQKESNNESDIIGKVSVDFEKGSRTFLVIAIWMNTLQVIDALLIQLFLAPQIQTQNTQDCLLTCFGAGIYQYFTKWV